MSAEVSVDSQRRLGIILLDSSHYTTSFLHCEPGDPGPGLLPLGYWECPATWPVPSTYTVARGATPSAVIGGDPGALAGVQRASGLLEPRCSMVIADCGFFFSFATSLTQPSRLVTTLHLLDLATTAAGRRPVVVLTYDARAAATLLRDHPTRRRLHFLGLDSLSTWQELGSEDWALRVRDGAALLRFELVQRLEQSDVRELADQAGAVLVECTLLSPLIDDIRGAFPGLPLFDLAALVRILLSGRSTAQPS
ncbi:aspartate/glutamate racemase family protein [Nocardioides terrisoli]|uniref:hypothetical protein n=1 Tax=Nocardioides terrisoli TaxID=3388267 RepID=UPI00287B8E7E|nr:hypothetical protein [Nocardioides marmorisolisilvae]